MGLRISLIILCLAVVMMFVWYPTTAKAQAIENGLVGHWTFDKKDTDAKETKDRKPLASVNLVNTHGKRDSESGGLITTRTNVSHAVVAVEHDGNRPIIPKST